MNNTILIDKTNNLINTISNKIQYTLQKKKQQIANTYFKNNDYIKQYVNTFYDNITDSFFDDGLLNRFTPFDFSKIPNNLHEELKEYLSQYYGLYYYYDEWSNGFVSSSFDNIYISYEGNIFSDFEQKTIHLSNDYNELELFLKLELLQAQHGIYPDIVYLDYYGQFKRDYIMPEEYKFLKTAMHKNEDRLLHFISSLIEIFDIQNNENWYNYRTTDNEIISDITPNFIQEIENNIDVEITEVLLSDNFDLHIQYNIPTQLKESDLKKLNITDYTYNQETYYGNTRTNTIINIDTNIKDWLKKELA